jgi:hypothetical protein
MRTAAAARQGGTAAGTRPLNAAIVMALVTAALPLSLPAAAQEPPPPPIDARPWFADVSHYGKWLALAGAAGFTTVAILRNLDADQIYGGLTTLCRTGGDTCVLGPDGTYVNPEAELLYQETLRLDSEARKWMLGGQVTLVAAGAMFVVDLVARTRRPKNIPYAPLEYFADGGRLGFRLRF